ncbi:MAG: coenzyme F420-0:L-glutamate ligase [Chloroflexota bacterium]
MVATLSLTAVPHLPEVKPGDNLAAILLTATQAAGLTLQTGDVLVIAQKIVSKAEGRMINLADVRPGRRAIEVAEQTGKDPRLVELILRESTEISRIRPGLIIVRHRLGFTSANAGIDRSNVPQSGPAETVTLLPLDPDASAARIRHFIHTQTGVWLGVLIIDSHGRPFRLGTVGTAIGVAGVPALWDRRGEADRYGYRLQHTEVGTADEMAAAASLLMGQAAEGMPAVLIRGLQLPPMEGKAADLIRPPEMDLYR